MPEFNKTCGQNPAKSGVSNDFLLKLANKKTEDFGWSSLYTHH